MRDERRFRRNRARVLLFPIAAWLLVFLGAEMIAQAAFHLLPATSRIRRLAYPSRFSLHRMARLVNDNRIATLIPGYQAVLSDDDYPANRPWSITIDHNGFRSRPEHYERKDRVVAFIGDSVPFGWGVADDHSVPARLYALLRERGLTTGVLNAAVPSYSLRQAVERFKIEVAERFPVRSLVVQTLDPPIAFSLLGDRWTPAISFHTRHRQPDAPLLGRIEDHLDRSLLLSAALRLAYRIAHDPSDVREPRFSDAAWRAFDAANAESLGALTQWARANDARVLLLPINPGPDPDRTYTSRERQVIDHYNRFLADFAAQSDATFVDVTSHFQAHPRRQALFVDSCCHLSEEGADVQAALLVEVLAGPASTAAGI